jgi:hypothetical protein
MKRHIHLAVLLAGCTGTATSTTRSAVDGDVFALERVATRGEEVEPAIAAALAAGYGSHDTRVVTRHALAHWSNLVRRHLDEPAKRRPRISRPRWRSHSTMSKRRCS